MAWDPWKFTYFTVNIDVFSQFSWCLSSSHFGPGTYEHNMDRNVVFQCQEWAEMRAWNTIEICFGPLGRAEHATLIIHVFQPKNAFFMVIFKHFRWLPRFIQLQIQISAQEWLQSKNVSQGWNFKNDQENRFLGFKNIFRPIWSGPKSLLSHKNKLFFHDFHVFLWIYQFCSCFHFGPSSFRRKMDRKQL